MKAIINDLSDPELYAPNPGWEYDEREKREKAAHEAIRGLVRDAWETDRKDHRTGCVTAILLTVAEVLMREKGWTSREVSEALCMEGIRAGGTVEERAKVLARKKWKADQLVQKAVAK